MRDIIRHRGGVAPLIAASVVFALWNTAYKYAVDGLPVATALSVMLLTAAAALWAFALVKGRQRLTQRQLRRIALAGAVDPALSYAAIGVGLSHIDATVSALMDGTEACFVVAFGALIARRAPGPRAVLGVLLSAAGVAALGGARSLFFFLFEEGGAPAGHPQAGHPRAEQTPGAQPAPELAPEPAPPLTLQLAPQAQPQPVPVPASS